MKSIYIALAACALAIMTACSGNNNSAGGGHGAEEEEHSHTEELKLSQTQMKTVGITIGHVVQKELGSVIRANGQLCLNPQDMADVTSLTGGIVRRVTVVEGQAVKAGQPLAYIENTAIVEMQKDYLVATKEREVAQAELQRQKALAQQGAGVEKTRQQAEAACAIAKARQTGLWHQLAQIGISGKSVAQGNIVSQVPVRAMISGVVGKINVCTGSYVDTSAPLMQIADNGAAYVSLNVFERNIAQVRVGQSVDLVVTNSPGVRLKGKVARINRTVDPQSKAVAVHVNVSGARTQGVIAGMYVSGIIQTGRHMAPALPDDAIVSAEGKSYVFVLDAKKKENGEVMHLFRRAEVVAGASALGYTQVDFVQPADARAVVVTGNAFYLASMSADHGEH